MFVSFIERRRSDCFLDHAVDVGRVCDCHLHVGSVARIYGVASRSAESSIKLVARKLFVHLIPHFEFALLIEVGHDSLLVCFFICFVLERVDDAALPHHSAK